jgi:hypothetical protein
VTWPNCAFARRCTSISIATRREVPRSLLNCRTGPVYGQGLVDFALYLAPCRFPPPYGQKIETVEKTVNCPFSA